MKLIPLYDVVAERSFIIIFGILIIEKYLVNIMLLPRRGKYDRGYYKREHKRSSMGY